MACFEMCNLVSSTHQSEYATYFNPYEVLYEEFGMYNQTSIQVLVVQSHCG